MSEMDPGKISISPQLVWIHAPGIYNSPSFQYTNFMTYE